VQTWWNFILSWSPFLLLIVFWIFFMKRMGGSRYGALIERSFQHMDRVEALLERIAVGLEQQRASAPSDGPDR